MSKQSVSIEARARTLSAELVGYLAQTDTHVEIITAGLSRERLCVLMDTARIVCRYCDDGGQAQKCAVGEWRHVMPTTYVRCHAGPIWDLIEAEKAT